MTAQTQIWHDKSKLPEQLKTLLIERIDGKMFSAYHNGTMWLTSDGYQFDPSKIEKWIYLDDLISQAAKVEELQEKLGKAIDCLQCCLYAPKPWGDEAEKVWKELLKDKQ